MLVGIQWITFQRMRQYYAQQLEETQSLVASKTLSKSEDMSGIIGFLNKKGESVHGNALSSVLFTETRSKVSYTHMSKTIEYPVVFVGTITEPPFIAVLVDPKLEAASKDVYDHGDAEIPTRLMFQYILNNKCTHGDTRFLMVDAGANLGYFATYAAVMGCNVIAVEPQPRLVPIIHLSAEVNGVSDRFVLLNKIVSEAPDKRVKINLAAGMCWGCSVVTPASPSERDGNTTVIINPIRLDGYISEDILLLKVDVEGHEVKAIESAEKIFKEHTVKNILVEWTPKWWPHDIERGNKLLEDLYDSGYSIRHYDLRMQIPPQIATIKQTLPIAGDVWEIPREKLREMNRYLKEKPAYANLWISKDR